MPLWCFSRLISRDKSIFMEEMGLAWDQGDWVLCLMLVWAPTAALGQVMKFSAGVTDWVAICL